MKPVLHEEFTNNGEFSHWNLVDEETGELLWTSLSDEECEKIIAK